MERTSDALNWLRINLLKAIIAVILILLCAATYVLVQDQKNPGAPLRLIGEIMPGAIVGLLAYLVGSWFLARAGLAAPQQLKDEIVETVASRFAHEVPGITAIYADITDVPWGRLFEASERIDIVARFFDGPITMNYRSLVEFFRRGGFMRIITVDPSCKEAMAITAAQRNAEQESHPDDVRSRLMTGLRVVDKARNEANCPPRNVEVILVPFAMNYTAYCFNDRELLLSPVEHFFLSRQRAPRVNYDLQKATDIQQFWRHEISVTRRRYRVVEDLSELLRQG